MKSDGTIWFGDPPYGIETDYQGGKRDAELPANLYRLDPRDGSLTVMADDFQGPNGLAFSPDERLLYVAETGHQFDASRSSSSGSSTSPMMGPASTRAASSTRSSRASAMASRIDQDGNLWSSAADGVHCIAPSGDLLGKIKVPSLVSNVTFGGRDRAQLFICASHTLYAVFTNQRGAQRP